PEGENEAQQLNEVPDVAPTDETDDSLDQGRRILAPLRLSAFLVGEEFVVNLQEFERVVLLDLPGHALDRLFFRDDWHRHTSNGSLVTALTSASNIVPLVGQRTTAQRGQRGIQSLPLPRSQWTASGSRRSCTATPLRRRSSASCSSRLYECRPMRAMPGRDSRRPSNASRRS